MNKTFVLCNGKVENCSKNECYIFGGQCRHTTNTKNAINKPSKRRFIKKFNGDNWEIE